MEHIAFFCILFLTKQKSLEPVELAFMKLLNLFDHCTFFIIHSFVAKQDLQIYEITDTDLPELCCLKI